MKASGGADPSCLHLLSGLLEYLLPWVEGEREREVHGICISRTVCVVGLCNVCMLVTVCVCMCVCVLTSILYPDGRSVIDCILSIVDGRVVPDEIEIALKFVEILVLVRLHFLLHRSKVHRLSYHLTIVRHLSHTHTHTHRSSQAHTWVEVNNTHTNTHTYNVQCTMLITRTQMGRS